MMSGRGRSVGNIRQLSLQTPFRNPPNTPILPGVSSGRCVHEVRKLKYLTNILCSTSYEQGTQNQKREPRQDGRGRGTTSARRSKPHDLSTVPARLRARAVAVEQLVRVEQDGAFVGLLQRGTGQTQQQGGSTQGLAENGDKEVERGRSQEAVSGTDARFVTELVSGVTRWQRRLDYIITELTGRDAGAIQPAMRQILRIGIYELLELGTPAHVVSEHVELAKFLVRPAAASMANGVLRQLLRLRESGNLPAPLLDGITHSAARADALAITYSHPTWMVQEWVERFGEEAAIQFMQWNNTRPVHGLRINTAVTSVPAMLEKLNALGCSAAVSDYLPAQFITLREGLQTLMYDGLHTSGECQVQDESAGMVVAILDPQPGEIILDACAAPGGKALFAASLMRGQGRLVAMDVNNRRLGTLYKVAAAQGLAPGVLEIRAGDLRAAAPIHARHLATWEVGLGFPPEGFHRVLLDVPCSGLGVLSKRADMRWRRTPAQIQELTSLQDELLDAGACLTRPGGLLVYSTCSIQPEENQERVDAFLARNPNFVAERIPEGTVPDNVVTAAGNMATLPHVHDVDGAFAARLRRVS